MDIAYLPIFFFNAIIIALVVYGFYLLHKQEKDKIKEQKEKDDLINRLSQKVNELESKIDNK